jgi:hypothetical protein
MRAIAERERQGPLSGSCPTNNRNPEQLELVPSPVLPVTCLAPRQPIGPPALARAKSTGGVRGRRHPLGNRAGSE